MKLVYLMKRIKLNNEYSQLVGQINGVRERLEQIDNQYDYANENIKSYFDCEILLLNKKYNEMLKEAKNIYKEVNKF